ncbi:rhomboid family intramembrane serine protease [Shewanella abyssi]|uniref:rhomboid family intramembrane serine protease n=1 Tax=Shewanella abyssi TaxID=311789 RepID=UPI0020101DD0|nr:rhomboid family intramembrane serine protease [Shewanella abyssi]MCL1048730.1 rhomboid family intramembrane serine protease [Shewanella abyssi]
MKNNNITKCKYNNKEFEGEEVVRSKILKWHVHQSLEVTEHNSNIFIPVIESSEYKGLAFKSNKSKSVFLIAYLSLSTCIHSVLYFYFPSNRLIDMTIASSVVTIYYVIEYIASMRNLSLLRDKYEFIQRVYLEKKGAYFYCLVMLFFGALQYLATLYYDSFQEVIVHFGGVYDLIDQGQYWRLLSASMFHSSVAHWMTNTALLMMFAPCFRVLSSNNGVSIFIIGAIVGAVMAYLSNSIILSGADGYVGASGGVYSLMGYFTVALFLQNRNIPSVWIYTGINFTMLNILLSIILLPIVSSFAHLSGFFTGAFLAVIFKNRDNLRFQQNNTTTNNSGVISTVK